MIADLIREKKRDFHNYWAQIAALPPFEKGLFYTSLVIGGLVLLIFAFALGRADTLRTPPAVDPQTVDPQTALPRYCVQGETPVYQYPVPEAKVTAILADGEQVGLTFYVTYVWLEVGHAHGRGYVYRAAVAECSAGGEK